MQKRNAQMAESVDALVSNTSGFTSIPVRPRVWVLKAVDNRLLSTAFFLYRIYFLKRQHAFPEFASPKTCFLQLIDKQYNVFCRHPILGDVLTKSDSIGVRIQRPI